MQSRKVVVDYAKCLTSQRQQGAAVVPVRCQRCVLAPVFTRHSFVRGHPGSERVMKSIEQGRQPHVTAESARDALEIVCAVYESARAVILNP
jgi:hypothetical protein